ncbi:MAG: hypothetical protein Q9204_002194, partial [Flavoplaca sp. TL-2023a]
MVDVNYPIRPEDGSFDHLRSSDTDFDNNEPGNNDHKENGTFEPLAVIGLSLKFPHDATTPEKFFQMMMEKRCVMRKWPTDRVNIEAFYSPTNDTVDTIPFLGGHFLKEPLEKFDAPFFSLTASEAKAMDPQQRLLLETAYRALENGCFSDDYKMTLSKDPSTLPRYTATGVAPSMLAARLSWFFNFTGPCVNLDSACSSSMVAFDLACQGLRNRETNMALVGGANVILGLEMSLPLSNMNFLSHDSRCFSFDHRANGYGRGEGFGVVVIKRLSDAIQDGDTIRAVVRSTGSNQDGRTPGITQPSMEAQLSLIRRTYAKAGLDMGPTRYVEAHGTGTRIGDPVEAEAIGKAFRKYRSQLDPLFIRGAVKSNIGHLEGASGIAGIIKAILVLESALIPPNANFEKLNPNIDADGLNIAFPKTSTPWSSRGLRRVSVMSFGFGGSNSQVVMDDACNFLLLNNLTGNHWSLRNPPTPRQVELSLSCHRIPLPVQTAPNALSGPKAPFKTPKLLIWSSADEDGLKRMASAYGAHVSKLAPSLEAEVASWYLVSLSHTLAARRTGFQWKACFVAHSLQEVTEQALRLSKAHKSINQPGLGYVFTGQGAQHAGMATELLCYPVFQTSLKQSETFLTEFGYELLKSHDVSKIDAPAYSQPICTAIQIALVDLLLSFGLVPSTVVGHSSGEIAAAYCLGALTQQSACKVAFFRGQCASKLVKSRKPCGTMAAVGLSEDAIQPYIDLTPGVVVACINSPESVTISGETAKVDDLITLWDKQSIFCRKLRVDVAYHSPQMLDVATDYLESLDSLEQRRVSDAESNIYMISTVTSRRITKEELQQPAYWIQNMVFPVKFFTAIRQLCPDPSKASGKKLGAERAACQTMDLLELGPSASLRGPVEAVLNAAKSTSIHYSSVLKRKVPAVETLLDALGHLYCVGHPLDVSKANQSNDFLGKPPTVLPDLPEYPFDHSREYWHESRLCKEGYRLRKNGPLDLLGTPTTDWSALDARWRGFLRLSQTPWIEEHKVNGTIVYPAAGMLVMAMEAANQLADNKEIAAFTFTDTIFSSPLVVTTDAQGTETFVQLRPLTDPSTKATPCYNFRVSAFIADSWVENCSGTIQVLFEKPENQVDKGREALSTLRDHRRVFQDVMRNSGNLDRKAIYDFLLAIGLSYGTSFQAVQDAFYDESGNVCGHVGTLKAVAPEIAASTQANIIHPTTLDGLFQLIMLALEQASSDPMPTMMPTRIGRLWISAQGISSSSANIINAHAEAAFTGRRKASSSMFALDALNESILVALENAEMTAVAANGGALLRQAEKRRLCYKLIWKPDIELLTSSQVLAYCEELRPQRPSAVEFYTKLDLLAIKFLSQALEALSEDHVRNAGSHLSQYHTWAKYQVERFRTAKMPFLSCDDSVWKNLCQDAQYMDRLVAEIKMTAQGRFYLKIAERLLSMLKGETDPLTFMFEDDSIPDFYREVNMNVICYEPLERYLELVSHKNPGLRILEVGAGTGATTDFILNALNGSSDDVDGSTLRCTLYDYTDISPAFFGAAASRFQQHHEQITFRVLDIAEDPAGQGFELGSYDLIIAASVGDKQCEHDLLLITIGQVLHATKNLEATMRNTRALLKPGGKLVVFEVTEDVIRARFAFGLLPGWWLSEEEHRQTGPCISIDEWDRLMRKTGFSGTDLNIPDYLEKPSHEYTIMISTAVGELEEKTPLPIIGESPTSHRVCIVVDRTSVCQESFASKLKDRLAPGVSWDCQIVSLKEITELKDLNKIPCIFLIELESALLAKLDDEGLTAMQHVIRDSPAVLWITNGGGCLYRHPQLHLIDGFTRVARTESSELNFVILAFDPDSVYGAEYAIDNSIDLILQIFDRQLSWSADQLEPEYQQKHGRLETARVVEDRKLNHSIHSKIQSFQRGIQAFGKGPPLALHIESPGLLESIHFIECPCTPNLEPGQLQIEIHATGVNFLDCLTALGQVDSTTIGGECAGIVSKAGPDCDKVPGDRVVALASNTYRSFTYASSPCVLKIPDGVSFAEASALPVIFVTAWVALHDTAHIQPGELVLIHAGAGGTGQAAIQVAQFLGAKVFVTVGSGEKKDLLMKLYGIPEERILYSRDTSFAQGIRRMTGERGVDVILNSLSGDILRASWDCIAPLGRFVEIGKRDIYDHANLPMWNFHKNVTYSSVDLLTIMKERPSILSTALSKIMSLFKEDKIHAPQPFQAFGISEVENVWRQMQTGKTAGKMVIEMRSSDSVPTVLRMRPQYYFDADKSYLIAGGLGGLGRSTGTWLADKGARNIILISRSGPASKKSAAFINQLEERGVRVHAVACDITNFADLSATLSRLAESMPPVRGVIQAAMVLQTIASWQTSIGPKVTGTYNLHRIYPVLDFFITLASIAGVIGSGGQANYAAGNTYMDALCRHRAAKGQKSISLDLGWMIDEGVVAESSDLQTRIADAEHMLPVFQAEFHALLDHYCNPDLVVGSEDVQALLGPQIPATLREKGLKEPGWMQRRTFAMLQQIGIGHQKVSISGEAATNYAALLSAVTSIDDAAAIITDGITQKLGRALR